MKKKKILFNCTTNIVGGGIKNSAFFIKNAVNSDVVDWEFAVSKEVYNLLQSWGVELNKDTVYVYESSPSKDKNARRKLLKLHSEINPDIVYTMAGPAYVKFPGFHVIGLSNAYITHADRHAFFLFGSLRKTIMRYVYSIVQLHYSRKADHFIFQTAVARDGFCKRATISKKRTTVISNARDKSLDNILGSHKNVDETFRIICPAAAYTHKGLHFIPAICKELKKITDKNFEFILTLENGQYLNKVIRAATREKVIDKIRNIGSYNYSNIKKVYSYANMAFVPSLLETFTTTYLEAMNAGIPLVAAEKDFARDICKDAAEYVNPVDANGAAQKFAEIFESEEKRNELVENGKKVLNSYPDQEERYKNIENRLLQLTGEVNNQ